MYTSKIVCMFTIRYVYNMYVYINYNCNNIIVCMHTRICLCMCVYRFVCLCEFIYVSMYV